MHNSFSNVNFLRIFKMPKRPKSDLSSEAILKRVGRRDKGEGPRDKAWTDELTKWVFANERNRGGVDPDKTLTSRREKRYPRKS